MIRLRAVRITYGATTALRDVNLDIEPGITGVFGPNGSGKSTLLRAACGLLRPAAGTVEIGLVPEGSHEELRRVIGYAGHQAGLYGRLTLRENLALLGRLYGCADERVRVVLAMLDLEALAERPVHALSAGLLRRAATARALLHDPQLLVLDEPYANLDDDAALLVTRAVTEWWRPDRIALVATHGAKRLKSYAHASLVLRRGEVASYRRAPSGVAP